MCHQNGADEGYSPIKLYTPAILHISPACFIGTIPVEPYAPLQL